MNRTVPHHLTLTILLSLSVLAHTAKAEATSPAPHANETKEQRDARLEWFQKAKSGLCIHWGLYSVAGGYWSKDGTFDSRFDGNPENDKGFKGYTEWICKSADMPMAEYSRMAGILDWSKFNARDYIDLCFASGQKYIVITAKHHDGFAMHHSKFSDYNIGDKTPTGQKTGRDPLKELADGLKLARY